MDKKIYIFDTTLRDGEQSPGISLSIREKLEIADQLERLGIDCIEAGFPITSLGDFEAVKAVSDKLKSSTVVGLSRAVDKDIDRAWEALKTAKNPRIHTFIMTSDIQLQNQLRKTKEEALLMAVEAVKRAKSYCNDVEFSPMDATRSDFDYLCKVISAVIDAGATVVNIPDTVGYSTPEEFGKLIKDLKASVPELDEIILSVHCHNDLGLAVANSLSAIVNGANQVECTINGLGERAGNAAMEEIAMIIETRKQFLHMYTDIKTVEITKTSRLISNLTGYNVQNNKAIVGKNAFAHSSGIHADGILKDRMTYEIIDPKKIGLTQSELKLGKTSGRHLFKSKMQELGHNLSDDELESAFVKFKDLADKKAEITEDDLLALVFEQVRVSQDIYALESISSSSSTGIAPNAEITLSIDGKNIKANADGDGQVDAVCKAISSATGIQGKLLSYNVSSITGGLDAQGDVTIQLDIDGNIVLGRGISTDIIEASARAYLNAINRSISK